MEWKRAWEKGVGGQPVLWMVHDPMCSWCWGFREVWAELVDKLPNEVLVQRLVGGLAPDTAETMPLAMQEKLIATWDKVSEYTGAYFNRDFWRVNTPRRSTYVACRAVIAAGLQGYEAEMIEAIQRAYYVRALNPSLPEVLQQCAEELAMDGERFAADRVSESVEQNFSDQRAVAQSIGGVSFPSLFLQRQGRCVEIALDYRDAAVMLDQINVLLRR